MAFQAKRLELAVVGFSTQLLPIVTEWARSLKPLPTAVAVRMLFSSKVTG
jgi:hypothetical protein